MKKLATVVGLIMAMSLPGGAQSWQYITQSQEGDKFYLDRATVRVAGDVVYFNSLRVKAMPEDGVAAVRTFRSMSCARGVWRTRRITEFDNQSYVLSDYAPGDKGALNAIQRDSVGEDLYNQLCR